MVFCTGHGVPGAFLSIIGYNALDKIIQELKIYEPAEILNQLNIEISNVLRQEEEAGVTDGMDIAIISIDYNTKQIEFAGSYNPLYIVRDGELLEQDGERIPIGKTSKKNEEQTYTNHTFQLYENDMLYIFSDGFVDQKVGKKAKKYKYPRFRGLLVSIAELPMEEQNKALHKELDRWMGDHQQFDDMLIYGIKI